MAKQFKLSTSVNKLSDGQKETLHKWNEQQKAAKKKVNETGTVRTNSAGTKTKKVNGKWYQQTWGGDWVHVTYMDNVGKIRRK